MPTFEYQFQLDPNDLKVIRDARGMVRFSPATSITVWAGGFAVCLLILGAIGAWSTLGILIMVAILFVSWYVHILNRKSYGDREYFTRTVILSDSGVIEKFGESMFEKSWGAFDEFVETPQHFLLRHYEKVTAIPKRVIPKEQIQRCREFIEQQTSANSSRTVACFDEWFRSESSFPVFQFRWRDQDIQQLAMARLAVYDRERFTGVPLNRKERVPLFLAVLILVAVGLLVFFNAAILDPGNSDWVRIVLFGVAIGFPFLVALAWWKYTGVMARTKNPRIPEEDIFVTLNDNGLMIGYPKAIARYHWNDVVTFHFCDQFIGFRPKHGLIHVIANHAFGGQNEAIDFLRLADQLANQLADRENLHTKRNPEQSRPTVGTRAIETGNPFQPPTYMS